MTLARWKGLTLISITAVVLVIDQWTKFLIYSKFVLYESHVVIKNFLAITYVQNRGAAFGFMNDAPAKFRDAFFIVVPIIVMFVILGLFFRLKGHQKLTGICFGLIFSGAIGNLIDRVRFGYVVDFIDFHWKEVWHYPAFNVADSCIVVGVCVLFLLSFKGENI